MSFQIVHETLKEYLNSRNIQGKFVMTGTNTSLAISE